LQLIVSVAIQNAKARRFAFAQNASSPDRWIEERLQADVMMPRLHVNGDELARRHARDPVAVEVNIQTASRNSVFPGDGKRAIPPMRSAQER